MRVLVWNSRGSSWPGFLSQALFYANSLRLDILCLLDTKTTDGAQKIADKLPFDDFYSVPAIGQSGGLILLWKTSSFKLDVISVYSRFIHCSLCDCGSMQKWLMTFVYAYP